MVSNADNPLIRDVPEWGAIFREEKTHPDNMLLELSEHKLRRLTRHEKRKFAKEKKRCNAILKRNNYAGMVNAYKALIAKYQSLKVQAHNGDDVMRELAITRAKGKMLRAKLEKSKPLTERLRYIAMREDEHKNAIAYEKRERRDTKEMRREVKHFAYRIIERYSQLGYKQVIIEGKKQRRYKVSFSDVWVTPDEIIYKIDVSKTTLLGSSRNQLPEGVKVKDLINPDTLAELEMACQRPVYSPHNPPDFMGMNVGFENGAFIVVCRLDFDGGLPKYIELKHLLERYRHDDRALFPIPVGVIRGKKIKFSYLSKSPHYMVNGLTGSGKSNVIRAWVSTLIQMHSPDEIRIMLTDLKRGGDFKPFEHIPHLLGDGIIKSPQSLMVMLERLTAVLYKRQERIGEIATNISEYNQLVSDDLKLPRVLVVIDEYSETHDYDDANIKKRIDRCVSIIARLGRAVGIQLVLGNQQPYADAIPASVKGNITSHLTGYQMTLGASFSTVGDGSARKIERIAGRMIFNDGVSIEHLQTPLATKADIDNAIAKCEQWRAPRAFDWDSATATAPLDEDTQPVIAIMPKKDDGFSIQDLITIALKDYDGLLAVRRIHEANSHLAPRAKMDSMVKWLAGQGQITHEGVTYIIRKGIGGAWKLAQLPTQDNPTNSGNDDDLEGNQEMESV